MNNIKIKILFVVLSFFLVVFVKAQPADYYNGIEGKSGEELKATLHNIIKKHVDFSYSFSRNIMEYTDADPADPTHVILFYTQQSRDASLYGTGGNYINREHVWAKSHGNFSGIRPMDSDVHNLHPADASVNEDRGNKDFDNIQPGGNQHPEALYCYYTDSTWEPGPETKGQVARTLFYMATRYEGDGDELDLELVSHNHTFPDPLHGNLDALLQWNRDYPPTDFERRRNERLFRIQQNRNPFVDHPEFADLIWGNALPADLKFSMFTMEPAIPAPGESITLTINIISDPGPDNVVLYWGNSYNSETNQITMQGNGNVYSATIQPTGFVSGNMIYLTVKATVAETSYSWPASFLYPEVTDQEAITSIPAIQGTGASSPIIGNEVTIAGRITANFDYSFYLQTSDPLRSGINVYNSLFRGNIGDSLIIRGKVDEYETLTEITDVTYNYNFKANREVTPTVITTANIGEEYEGMLITIKKATFQDKGEMITANSSSFTFSDQYGSAIIYTGSSSRLIGHYLPTSAVNITGILSQYKDGYQVLPRDYNDFDVLTDAPVLDENNAAFYPNPVNGILNIRTKSTITQLSVRNLMGQLILQTTPKTNQINLTNLKAGIYLVEVRQKNGTILTGKILKTDF